MKHRRHYRSTDDARAIAFTLATVPLGGLSMERRWDVMGDQLSFRLLACSGLVGLASLAAVIAPGAASGATVKTVSCPGFKLVRATYAVSGCVGTDVVQTGPSGVFTFTGATSASVNWKSGKTSLISHFTKTIYPAIDCPAVAGYRKQADFHEAGLVSAGTATGLVGGRFSRTFCQYTSTFGGAGLVRNVGVVVF